MMDARIGFAHDERRMMLAAKSSESVSTASNQTDYLSFCLGTIIAESRLPLFGIML